MRRQKLSQRQLLLYLADARRKRREDFRIAYRKSNAFMFPDEVIRNICVLVQVPPPPRGTDARPVGRKDWAQPLLATLMRVSKVSVPARARHYPTGKNIWDSALPSVPTSAVR